MPRVSSPGELGVGRGAGKISALNLPQRRATATPETFGAGIRAYAPDERAFGGQTIAPQIQPGKSGLELLADTVSKVASIGFDTALAVDHANTMAAIQQSNLQNRTDWLQQSLATEATIEEGADPGEYAKNSAKAFDDFKTKKLEGLSGLQKQAVEQDLGELAMHNMERATDFQGQRARQYRQAQNEVTFAATQDQYHSAYNLAFTDPGQMPALLAGALKTIDTTHLPEDQKAKLRRDATGGLADAMWAGKLEHGDPYAVRDAMLRADPVELGGLEFNDRLRHLSGAETKINRLETEARQRQAEARAAAAAARQGVELKQRIDSLFMGDAVDKAAEALDHGLPVEPAALGALAEQSLTLAKTALDPDTARRAALQHEKLQAAVDTQNFSKAFAILPRQQQEAEIARRLATPIDPTVPTPEAAELAKAQTILSDTRQAISENRVLERAAVLGAIPPLAPVDLTNPQQIADRVHSAHMAGDHLSAPVEMFTPAEREAEAAKVAAMPGEQKAAYLASVQAAAGDSYPDVIRELGAKGGLDRSARYMAILAGRPEGARIANAVGEAIDTKPEDLKVNLVRAGQTEAELDRRVEKQLRSWMDSLGPTYAQGSSGANAMISDVFDMVKQTALVQMRTMSFDEAIRSAADGFINSRYEFRGDYRIPKPAAGGDAYAERLDKMMADTVAALAATPEIVQPPASIAGVDDATRRAGYVAAIQNRGKWANLPDESGLVLLDELGNAVIAAGQPVIVKF